MKELSARIGYGKLDVRVEFDQAYAHKQHEDMLLKHPHGGGPQYLRRALFGNIPEYLTIMSEGVLTDLDTAAKITSEHLAAHASRNAPKRSGGLDRSAHPMVFSHGMKIYDRPPQVRRRTPEQIRLKNEKLQQPKHWYGAWPPVFGSRASRGEAPG